eukprot:PLAT13631.1.p1 GENE.PLAT13631.1~~PLAT13631.1.p1  ORF type:complete len:250 (-),score=106.38 PLAT13631.1:63-812(-)
MAEESEVPAVVIHGKQVEVSGEEGVDIGRAISCPAFQEWQSGLDAGLDVSAIHFQSLDLFGSKVGFVKFRASVTRDGKFVPGIVFMRGPAVGVLVVLRCEGELFTLCTEQARVPTGRLNFLEIPAGMLEADHSFSSIARKELFEETGLHIGEEEGALVDLTALAYGDDHPGMYPSAGGCDEYIRLFLHQQDMSREEMDALRGKVTGLAEENEFIVLRVLPLESLWRRSADAKALAALLLYEKLKAAGEL